MRGRYAARRAPITTTAKRLRDLAVMAESFPPVGLPVPRAARERTESRRLKTVVNTRNSTADNSAAADERGSPIVREHRNAVVSDTELDSASIGKTTVLAETHTGKANITCVICLQPVVDGKDEAVFCEGKCQRWLHRRCASIGQDLLASLSASDEPFLCLICSYSSLQQKVTDLSDEVTRLKATLEDLPKLQETVKTLSNQITALSMREPMSHEQHVDTTSSSGTSTYASIAAKATLKATQQISHKTKGYASHQATGKPRKHGSNTAKSRPTTTTQRTLDNQVQTTPAPRRQPTGASAKVRVEGARRIWGTMKITTSGLIKSAISRICSIDSVRVKRKTTTGTIDGKIKSWWFIVHGSEEVLKELEQKWNLLHMQTNWKLEPCFMSLRCDNAGDAGGEVAANTTGTTVAAQQDTAALENTSPLLPPPTSTDCTDSVQEDATEAHPHGNNFLDNN